jgi:hypothetical protein
MGGLYCVLCCLDPGLRRDDKWDADFRLHGEFEIESTHKLRPFGTTLEGATLRMRQKMVQMILK